MIVARLDKPTVAELLSAEAAKNEPKSSSPESADDADEDLGGMVPSPA